MTEGNFVDYVKLFASSGNGGKGSIHLHREKFITKGGPELSMIWQASQAFQVAASFGHLVAQFDDYTNVDGLDLAGRDQPHAPLWQYRINIAWQISQALSASLEGTGRDRFYLSDRHSGSHTKEVKSLVILLFEEIYHRD